jgi:hypothetical protein
VGLQEPTIHEPDPVLGWRAKPGQYVFPPYTPEDEGFRITILADGARRTGRVDGDPSDPLVVLLGGSLALGWAVSDHEAFAWKLQEAFPAANFKNFATGGYGTYQSLLLLEELISIRRIPDLVLYGFFWHHENRNVGDPAWLDSLARVSTRAAVDVPYCTLDSLGTLKRHSPERHRRWPLMDRLSTVSTLNRVYSRFRGKSRLADRTAVTQRLLSTMKTLSSGVGASFVTVLLAVDPARRDAYLDLLRSSQIDYIDCAIDFTPDLIVTGEGHPNSRGHALWASCIADGLRQRIPTLGLPSAGKPAR